MDDGLPSYMLDHPKPLRDLCSKIDIQLIKRLALSIKVENIHAQIRQTM